MEKLSFWISGVHGAARANAGYHILNSSMTNNNKMGLEVIGIHSLYKSETAGEFLSENNYTFLAGIDTGETANNYAVTAWPTYYLIDKNGYLVWGPKHAPPSEKQIESLLKD